MDKWYEDPVYIKQCDCPEIQNIVIERVKNDGGWLRTSAVGLIVNAIAKDGEVFKFHLDTWLPAQDQLQEMVDDRDICIRRYANGPCKFWQKCSDYGEPEGMIFPSPEQLWLAFVMKENHGKVWSNYKWIKET